jgi:hypothetical protein
VQIYIDEAGSFLPPNTTRSAVSLVLALIVPTTIEQELYYEFLRLRDTWPNQNVEIKGSSLNESQAAQLITLLLQYDTLVQFIASQPRAGPPPLRAGRSEPERTADQSHVSQHLASSPPYYYDY